MAGLAGYGSAHFPEGRSPEPRVDGDGAHKYISMHVAILPATLQERCRASFQYAVPVDSSDSQALACRAVYVTFLIIGSLKFIPVCVDHALSMTSSE